MDMDLQSTAGLIRIIIQFMDFFIFRSELSDLHCNFSLVCAYLVKFILIFDLILLSFCFVEKTNFD